MKAKFHNSYFLQQDFNIESLQRNVGKHESFMEKLYGALNNWYIYHHPHMIKLLI